MMQQYQGIRRTLSPDTLLMFRLGDFYEMFFDDAHVAAGVLNLALTKRNQVPMCGIPFHAAEGYVRKLIEAGHRVAICDQTSEPQPGRIVQREITQILSPGTVSDMQMLDAKRNNYLATLVPDGKGRFGLAVMDLSTGDFRVTELEDERALTDELERLRPAEVVMSEEHGTGFGHIKGVVFREGYPFLLDQAQYALLDHFRVQSLDGFGITGKTEAIRAAGGMIHYLRVELKRKLTNILRIRMYSRGRYMGLDSSTRANLELVDSRGAGRDTSLLKALDRTCTPMGARRLREWILQPLCDVGVLESRQAAIGAALANGRVLAELREVLGGVRDMERTLGRLVQAGGNARDLVVLRVGLEQVPGVQVLVDELLGGVAESALFREIRTGLHALPEVVELLSRALVDEPPALVRDGGMFRDGYFAELDQLRSAGAAGKEWVADLQQRAADETGIKSLKIRYTSVFGYFIEVTKANLHLVPETWIRKQTVAGGERFVTPELKEMESKILGADERARALEVELFQQLRDEVLQSLGRLQETAAAISRVDVVCGLAEVARTFGYVRPKLTEGGPIRFVDGRHPVLDQSLVEEKFVPNDTVLDDVDNRLMVITGPNMAGKSTYIRQVALLTLMAQIGSWVPAREAEVGVVDRIFTRVGASDDMSRGQSTFMVEMNETANIANNATARSLVILDEIGRGTSTFDGLSIAWSVAEFLHDVVQCKTLFATHYHELTELANARVGVKNYTVAVREWNDQIIFLRKIVPGGADRSYGIQVARLAGLPVPILERAKEILANLERSDLVVEGAGEASAARRSRRRAVMATEAERPQMMLF